MPGFHEVLFPLDVALKGSGGPERRTEIVTLASGREERNQRWANSRRRYDAGYGVRTLDALHAVIAFFEERRGRLYGFRWRDRADWKSGPPSRPTAPADQAIGTGDGASRAFQLVKRYGSGGDPWTRAIVKPVAGSVRVAVAGVEKASGTDFTLDATTGIVTFLPGKAPPAGAAVTAGFSFDVPVRFDTDELIVDLEAFGAGQIPHVPLVEIIP
jgi:uncharacterized protein (TIGR02217 family)